MEISLRVWLAIGGILLVVLIIFDGWRRVRQSKSQLKMAIDKKLVESMGESNDFNPELPMGGARVKGGDQAPDEPSVEEVKADAVAKAKPKPTTDEEVNDLLFGSHSSTLDTMSDPLMADRVYPDLTFSALDRQETKTPPTEEIAEAISEPVNAPSDAPTPLESVEQPAGRRSISLADIDPDKVLMITAVAGKESPYNADDIDTFLTACQMEFGDQGLYHRFESRAATSALQFSVANATGSGAFPVEGRDEVYTPGVTFFMSLESPKEVMIAYECMLGTAEALVGNFGGELLDDLQSVMRPQTKAHYRERIRNFEMQNLARKGH